MIYFSLYVAGQRIELGHVGAEYRHIVGLPGGKNSPLFSELERANDELFILKDGIGSDLDNLYDNSNWIMDSTEFSYYQGEIFQ